MQTTLTKYGPRQHRQAQEMFKSSLSQTELREEGRCQYYDIFLGHNKTAKSVGTPQPILDFTPQAPRVEFPKAIIRIHFIKLPCLTLGYCIRNK